MFVCPEYELTDGAVGARRSRRSRETSTQSERQFNWAWGVESREAVLAGRVQARRRACQERAGGLGSLARSSRQRAFRRRDVNWQLAIESLLCSAGCIGASVARPPLGRFCVRHFGLVMAADQLLIGSKARQRAHISSSGGTNTLLVACTLRSEGTWVPTPATEALERELCVKASGLKPSFFIPPCCSFSDHSSRLHLFTVEVGASTVPHDLALLLKACKIAWFPTCYRLTIDASRRKRDISAPNPLFGLACSLHLATQNSTELIHRLNSSSCYSLRRPL